MIFGQHRIFELEVNKWKPTLTLVVREKHHSEVRGNCIILRILLRRQQFTVDFQHVHENS